MRVAIGCCCIDHRMMTGMQHKSSLASSHSHHSRRLCPHPTPLRHLQTPCMPRSGARRLGRPVRRAAAAMSPLRPAPLPPLLLRRRRGARRGAVPLRPRLLLRLLPPQRLAAQPLLLRKCAGDPVSLSPPATTTRGCARQQQPQQRLSHGRRHAGASWSPIAARSRAGR